MGNVKQKTHCFESEDKKKASSAIFKATTEEAAAE